MILDECHSWHADYRGIVFEINKFHIGDREGWAYYLYLRLDAIPEESNPESFWLKSREEKHAGRPAYDYSLHEIMSDLDWHGGITYYSKESSDDDGYRVIKIGCDYQHSFDQGQDYTVESVLLDVKRSIDKFRELVPGYKYWCRWNGKLHKPSEIEEAEDGSYRCDCVKKKHETINGRNTA
jgi:hypothetical protein